MHCVIKCIVRGNQARVKNADLRHPSCTVVMQRRKSASPVRSVLKETLQCTEVYEAIPTQAYNRPLDFQEFEAPRFLDSRHMKVVML